MNALEIYVKSSALGNTGIHWRNISKTNQPCEDPRILTRRIVPKKDGSKGTIEYLYNDTKHFLVIAFYENKIFLQVTGIKASQERSERLKREVIDIIAWLGDRENDNEQVIRFLAVRALFSFWGRDLDFLKDIRSAIKFYELEAFQVELEKINKLMSTSKEVVDRFLEDRRYGIDDQSKMVWNDSRKINSDREVEVLAYQILQNPLPDDTRPHVVVVDASKYGSLDLKTVIYEPLLVSEPNKNVSSHPADKMKEEDKKKAHLSLTNLGIFAAGLLIGLVMGLLIAIVFLGAKIPPKAQPESPPPQLLNPQVPPPQSAQPAEIDENQNPPCLQVPPCLTPQMKNSQEI